MWSVIVVPFVRSTIPASSRAAVESSQGGSTGNKTRQPNLHVPNLYADKIDFIATIVDLPGAKKKESYWELSYQLFFVPEEKYYETIYRLPKGGSNPEPEEFAGRILLAEGRQKRTRLETLDDRTITLTGVSFKHKIPDSQRTKFGYLLTGYSVKIFDAELNKTIYYSGIFLTEPYEPNVNDEKQDIARNAVYLTFRVLPNGTLGRSQLRPKIRDTNSK